MSWRALQDQEQLREVLLDLERTRARQKEALDVSNQLLRCLRVFDAPAFPDKILGALLAELGSTLQFEDAFFLSHDGDDDTLRVTAATSSRFEGTRWTPGPLFLRVAKGMPASVFDVALVEEWRAQPEAVRQGVKSALHVGLRTGARAGFLVCVHPEVGFFAERHRRLAAQLAPLASQALEKLIRAEELSRINARLRREMAEREEAQRALDEAQRALVTTARRAGMADVATHMLHNVGNVLNSLQTAAATAIAKTHAIPAEHIRRSAELLRANAERLGPDPRAAKLPELLSLVAVEMENRQCAILSELASITSKLDHIAAIIDVQHHLAIGSALLESVEPASVIEEALQIQSASLEKHRIVIVRDLAPAPELRLDKHRLLQVLVNLISNACHALLHAREPRRLALRQRVFGDVLRIELEDNGAGIAAENLQHIFQHGFTTRQDGHGYGLHSGALAMNQMGGTLKAYSEGEGRGACFTIELPVRS